ncbi:DPP6 N-terminal domain-like protein [Hirschfeldia incana]|nr:DPP6 N-terminal domain-like protein [Hirschfeldia incana]
MNIAQIIFLALLLLPLHTSAEEEHTGGGGDTIVFATLGRPHYEFDIFSLSTTHPPSISTELRITDGESVNFNGYFPSPSPALISLLPDQTLIQLENSPPVQLIYVTERNGTSSIYYDLLSPGDSDSKTKRRSLLETPSRIQIPLLSNSDHVSGTTTAVNSFKDKPSLSGEFLVYVSTHENSNKARTSWTAVYSTELRTGSTRRLTPSGIADFSPAVSPSGNWTAVASYGERGWSGEVEELSTDIYVFSTRDGTQRVKVVEHGGWPCWADESTLYFHRRSDEDGWISVFRAILTTESVKIQRVTPPGVHAFTPATSPNNHEFIAVATRRPGTDDYRHVELFDLKKNEFTELTRLVALESHHYNPFLSPDSSRVGYHSCRGEANGKRSPLLLLENIQTTTPDLLSLFRIDGSFPSFSPKGDRIAYVEMPGRGVYVANPDGSGRRKVFDGKTFATVWDPVREGRVYTSLGPTFATERTEVDIISIDVDAAEEKSCFVRRLTTNGQNNAFPWPSPDGKLIVFRSGRSGHKNLYLMDAERGESGGLWRLTEGAWTDTMCSWSPDGEWIAFASDRESSGSGSFELFLIHPDGTGLRKLIQSGTGGRTNHPIFSPDSKSIVFTSDYAGLSAEPISNPHHFQPYGDIFTVKLDGSGLRRLTHNAYEDGTPAWAPRFIRPGDVVLGRKNDSSCSFDDCHWLNKNPTLKDQRISC